MCKKISYPTKEEANKNINGKQTLAKFCIDCDAWHLKGYGGRKKQVEKSPRPKTSEFKIYAKSEKYFEVKPHYLDPLPEKNGYFDFDKYFRQEYQQGEVLRHEPQGLKVYRIAI